MISESACKSSITNKLLQREDERVLAQQYKRAEKQELLVTEETTEYFKTKFSELKQDLNSKLNNVENVSVESRLQYIEELLTNVNILQKLLTESTHFLSQFTIKASQSTITNLKNKIQDIKSQYLPKKKFGFKTKTAKPTDEVDNVKIKTTNNCKQKLQLLLGGNALDIKDLTDSEVTKCCEDTDSKDVILLGLLNCNVKLLGSPSAVHIFKVSNSKIYIGPVKGSILVEDCTNCIFVVACQQMRIHKTTHSTFYIHVTSRAIIEECSSLKFAPMLLWYESLEKDFEGSGLDKITNNWNLVEDFNWLVPDVHSPNWSILPEDERTLS